MRGGREISLSSEQVHGLRRREHVEMVSWDGSPQQSLHAGPPSSGFQPPERWRGRSAVEHFLPAWALPVSLSRQWELPSFSGVLPVFFDFSDACSVCFAFWLDFPWFPCSFPQASLRNKICWHPSLPLPCTLRAPCFWKCAGHGPTDASLGTCQTGSFQTLRCPLMKDWQTLFLRISVASRAPRSRCTYRVLLKQNPQAWEISRGNGWH